MKKIQRSRRKITKRFAIVDITRIRVMIFGMHNWRDLTPECILLFLRRWGENNSELKGTVSRNSAKLGNCKMSVKLRET